MKDRNSFDNKYYEIMSKSKFTLCPAGDCPWSMRFYEALLCKSIPIVNNSLKHGIRKKKLDYKYYLTTDENKFIIKNGLNTIIKFF